MVEIDVLIPSYNCGQWITRAMDSVATQQVRPRRVLVIDDASTEAGYAAWCARYCAEQGWMFLRNAVNAKCPKNLFTGIPLLETPPDGVIFLLDGDDFLPHNGVFGRIAEAYADPEIWFTYGNYAPHPHDTGQTPASAYPPEIIEARSFRANPAGRFNHPLTFRRHLFDRLTPADAQFADGRWMFTGYDLILCMPFLEMTAPRHYQFIDEVLYCYNAVNPMSESVCMPQEVDASREVLSRPMKARL